ncbi:tyrosine-type recombinase/integrase [Anaeromusa acidaminophila]|uniref:tyrosine-type recombinase/integrase n=1 Tax=Anaeromusa acidaminophila TaxID=81464 RepID=UPI000361E467|nr:site-specific integrase [Anaeromusa acidaminophila]
MPVYKRRISYRPKQKKATRALWTVADWVTHWYEHYKEPKHSPTTRQVQWVYIRLHIAPYFGLKFIHTLTTQDVQEFLNYLAKEGNKSKLKYANNNGNPLAPWTIKKIRALLMSSMEAAIKYDLIDKNPVRDTESIPVQTIKVAHFTLEQQTKFLEGTKNHRFHVAYQLLFYTGCRRSEVLGLSWNHVDFENSQINIQQVLVSINGVPHLKKYPKTKSSVRTIPLHPSLCKLLKQQKKLQEKEEKAATVWKNKDNLVFCNKDGSYHSPSYFLHNFKAAVRRLGLPKNLRVHSTRHSFATNLLQLGVALSDVQHLGGWADTRVVLEIYSHAVQVSQRKAVQKLFNHTK